MLVDRIVKETTDISRDFLDMSWWLDAGETITTVVSQKVMLGAYGWSDAPYPLTGGEVPYDPFPLEIQSAVIATGGTQLEVFVQEGSPSLAYTCQFVLDGSSTRRVTIEMGVQVTGVALGALGSGPLPSYLAVTIADTPPSDPQPGQLWFDSIDPQLYIWYDDPSSSQWVIVTSDKGGLANDAPYDGQVYGRQNGVWVQSAGGSGGPYLLQTGGTITAPTNSTIPALTILASDNGPTTMNGLLVKQGYQGGGLGMGHGATGWTGSFQFGPETYHDHNAIVFNNNNRVSGQYNNLESVLTIPAGNPSSQLTNAFTASVHDYSGGGALAGIFYAIGGADHSTLYALNTVCTDRSGTTPHPAPLLNTREQIEFDYFASHSSTSVRGVLTVLSAVDTYGGGGPLVPASGVQWIAFLTGLFPGSAPWNIAFSSGNGGAQIALLVGTTIYGGPTTTGNKSQPIQFNYTDNTTATTQHVVSLFTDPTFAGPTGTELRLTGDPLAPVVARVDLTIDNLAFFKSVNQAKTASLNLMGLDAQDRLGIGSGTARTLIQTTDGSSAEFICANPNSVNDVQIMGNSAGLPVQVVAHPATGSPDVNIGMNINAAGTGVLELQTGGALTDVVGPLNARQAISLLNTINGPNITAGSAPPSIAQPKGSIYLRTNGGVGSTLYVSQGAGGWNAVAGV